MVTEASPKNYTVETMYCYTRQEFISTFGTDDWFTIVSHETFSLSLVDCLNCTTVETINHVTIKIFLEHQ